MAYEWVEGVAIAAVGAVVGAIATMIVSALRERPRLEISDLSVDDNLNVRLTLTNKGPVGTTLDAAWIEVPDSDNPIGLRPLEKKQVQGGFEWVRSGPRHPEIPSRSTDTWRFERGGIRSTISAGTEIKVHVEPAVGRAVVEGYEIESEIKGPMQRSMERMRGTE